MQVMTEQGKAPAAIFLIGMMASGKSTVGRCIAEKLGWEFFDVDREIEASTGVSIAYIFEKEGEAGFRSRETAKMAELTHRPRTVVAMGGGAPMFEVNRKLLKRGLVVYLTSTVSDVLERTRFDKSRPLLQAEDPVARVRKLLLERGPVYEATADVKVATSRTHPQVVADRILALEAVQAAVAAGNEAQKKEQLK